MRVKDKVALVTGGAKGIGEATAILLAREGARVVLTDLDHESGEIVARKINDLGGVARFILQDVADEERWREVVDDTIKWFNKLDILVNNAGIAHFTSLEEETLEKWKALQAINLDAIFLGTREAIRVMKERKSGSIINVSSVAGLVGDPLLAAYNASKGGVRLFTKSAALHCGQAGYGIRVNSVHPGYICTPLMAQIAKNSGNQEEYEAQVTALHPIGRLGVPDDIASGILYLASDEASFVTGSELVIDGGYTAQ
ncbi:MAG: Dehydrogenase [Candidatus Tokpelaia hoelldobleri]|uniref:Dehydrogenase n=1 Tax=Candidatus Tokpelaia hoelldobleri TaxID=1902579 RepID=A0A1U9JVQ6_9HYPH|nr:MAG: Dehydrogenase [Candidatus Tokpelaia hoelldoblerii]